MESNEFIATKDQLKNIRAFVKSLLNEKDFSKDEIEKIILAVGEASMNIVQHAYKGGSEDKKIKVEIEIKEKKLLMRNIKKKGEELQLTLLKMKNKKKYCL